MDSTSRSFARLVAPLAACVAAVASISLLAPSDNFVDRALPLYAAALAVIALLEGRRFGDAPLAFALPLLAVVRIACYDENLRILLYGALLAAVALTFAGRVLARFGRLTTVEGLQLTGTCVAAMKLVPFGRELAVAQVAVIVGVLLLALSLASRDGLGAGALIVCIAAGLVTPLDPLKAALFPIVLAATLAAVRGPSPFSIGALIVTAAIAGRWAWPIAVIAIGVLLLEELVEPLRSRRTAPAALGLAAFGALPLATGALATAAFSPESIASLPRFAMRPRLAAVALGVAALVLRPSLGALYMIVALALLLAEESVGVDGTRRDVVRVPLVAAVFVAAMLALLGYSGAVASRFPLPLPIAATVTVAVVALAALPARRTPGLAVALSAAVLVGAIALSSAGARGETIDVRAVLAPGESFERTLPTPGDVSVELAGGNLMALEPGTPVASVEAFDREGRVVRREIVIGDVADWGFGRPGHYFAARNEWPWTTRATVAEYGHEAFFGGSGTVALDLRDAVTIRVTAAASLPAEGRLNIDSIRVVRR
ncbi:MAG: hypothetical protein WC538_15960 [Thermoanaerobaculia bacterium]